MPFIRTAKLFDEMYKIVFHKMYYFIVDSRTWNTYFFGFPAGVLFEHQYCVSSRFRKFKRTEKVTQYEYHNIYRIVCFTERTNTDKGKMCSCRITSISLCIILNKLNIHWIIIQSFYENSSVYYSVFSAYFKHKKKLFNRNLKR